MVGLTKILSRRFVDSSGPALAHIRWTAGADPRRVLEHLVLRIPTISSSFFMLWLLLQVVEMKTKVREVVKITEKAPPTVELA